MDLVRKRGGTRRCGDQRGAELVELAIALPLFLMLLFGIVEFGAIYKDSAIVGAAAREAARLGAVNPNVDVVKAKANDVASGLPRASTFFSVTVTCLRNADPCTGTPFQSGDTMLVTAVYQHQTITPIARLIPGIGKAVEVKSKTAMRVE